MSNLQNIINDSFTIKDWNMSNITDYNSNIIIRPQTALSNDPWMQVSMCLAQEVDIVTNSYSISVFSNATLIAFSPDECKYYTFKDDNFPLNTSVIMRLHSLSNDNLITDLYKIYTANETFNSNV